MNRIVRVRRLLTVGCLGIAVLVGAAAGAVVTCGPFTDVAADAFCPFVLEIFYLGITTGTTPTTYDPSANVNRLQMAAFLSRTVDRALLRGSRRAALARFTTAKTPQALGLTTVGLDPEQVKSDGADLWVSHGNPGAVSRVRASSGKLLETWTGAGGASGVVAAMGLVLVSADQSPSGRLYRIDPTQAAGAVTTVATNLGNRAFGLAFDGSRFWTANLGSPGSVSIITPGASLPWTVTTVTAGFSSFGPGGILYDGANIWVTDLSAGKLFKLDGGGGILLTVTVGSTPEVSVFDGTSIWVPNDGSDSVSVVRASTGAVLATLTGNGINAPTGSAFDGERVLVVNGGGDSVSLWKAADLTSLGTFDLGAGTQPLFACSDGVNFWITLSAASKLARF
jgi:hypothetical protein